MCNEQYENGSTAEKAENSKALILKMLITIHYLLYRKAHALSLSNGIKKYIL